MTIFVSGASGQLGRRVVHHLLTAGATVVAGTRRPGGLDVDAEVRRFDYEDASTFATAFAGVRRALLISSDDVGNRAPAQVAAVRAAAQAGVDHLAYTSIVRADDPQMAISADHRATEAAIREHFASHTLLRNNLYADLVPAAMAPAVQSGSLYTAREVGRIAWVSREDCARAAAAALLDGFDGQRTLEITGPEALSGAEMAALFAELSGKPVQHVSLPAPALIEGLLGAGIPRVYAEMLAAFDVSAAAGLLGAVSEDVETLTGRAPNSLRDVLGGQ